MKKILFYNVLFLSLLSGSCSDFLELKPDIKMVVPSTVADAELLLNDYTTLHTGYPIWGELGTDDYYLTTEKWSALSTLDQRNAYIWADEPYMDVVQWQRPYKTAFIANQVLDILSKDRDGADRATVDRLSGGAYFYRAFAFHQLIEVHAPAYQQATASKELGIPLRLTPNIDEVSVRASLEESYGQVVRDFRRALALLPIAEPVRGRPSKAAAYGALARVFLDMGDFDAAYRYADSCLAMRPELMDFNTLKASETLPIPQFNVEVLFPAMSANALAMNLSTALVDSTLYRSYQADDLRKVVFFRTNTNPRNTYAYKGNYNKSSAQLFVGITTSEIYLIKAEAAVRIGKVQESLQSLNILLEKRWKEGRYEEITETDPEKLLAMVITERQKELLFRGRRWADLKRLNLEPRFRRTLVRKIGEETYALEPNSPKYAYRVPEIVVSVGEMPQNKR